MPPDQEREIVPKEAAMVGGKAQVSTLIYCAFTFPLFLFALFVIRDLAAILVFGMFAAFGVAGIVMMVRVAASQRKFGDLRLRLDDPLPSVGGRLNATLQLPASATAAAVTVRANLLCSSVTYDKRQSRTETAICGVRMEVPVAKSASGALVRFDCDIPEELPPAEDPGAIKADRTKSYAVWELKVSAHEKGVDLERSYAIAVGPAVPGMTRPKRAAPIAAEVSAPLRAAIPEQALTTVATASAATARPADKSSIWVLVALNLVPLAGVAYFGWKVQDIVMLYWIENLVIGGFNLLRIAIAVPDVMPILAKLGIDVSPRDLVRVKAALIVFFLAHYGAFCYVHGTFLAAFFPAGREGGAGLLEAIGRTIGEPIGLAAVLGIVASHAYSFLRNYVGRGEYLRASMPELMFRPYKRIFATHLFVIAGGFVAMAMNSPLAVMVVFVAVKIGFDAHFHRRERKMYAAVTE